LFVEEVAAVELGIPNVVWVFVGFPNYPAKLFAIY